MADGEAQIIWSGRVDGRFDVRVVRVDGNTGRFTVADSVGADAGGLGTLASEEVRLMYQAAYGADVDDIAAWMDRAVEIVDAAVGRPGSGPPDDPAQEGAA